MDKKHIQIYCGDGNGKSSAAFGQAVKAACAGKSVFLIQFLKGKDAAEAEYLKKLEPEIKLFSFDKFAKPFNELSPEEKAEECEHIRNGVNYARKVLQTGECDLLVLDEILGLPEKGAVKEEEIRALVECVPEGVSLIMTGQNRTEPLWPFVDEVTEVRTDYRK